MEEWISSVAGGNSESVVELNREFWDYGSAKKCLNVESYYFASCLLLSNRQ